jgi:hypothetical protein
LSETIVGEVGGNGKETLGVPGGIPLPRRSGPKTMLPSTWLNRGLKVSYTDCYGGGQETSGTLLDLYPAGPVLNIAGSRTMICWDRLCLVELADG